MVSLSLKVVPPQAQKYGLTKPKGGASPSPSEGGDVPGGIQNAGSWGYKRKKN